MGTQTAASDEDRDRYASYLAGWRRRAAEAAEKDRGYRAEARREARRAAELLARRFGVERVILFGSMLGDHAGCGSDVDLAVEGLDPGLFIKADALLAMELSVPVDLKLVKDCPPLLQRRIAEDGMVLYER